MARRKQAYIKDQKSFLVQQGRYSLGNRYLCFFVAAAILVSLIWLLPSTYSNRLSWVVLIILAFLGLVNLIGYAFGFISQIPLKNQNGTAAELFDCIDIAIAVTDVQGQVFYCNKTFRSLDNFIDGQGPYDFLAQYPQTASFIYSFKNSLCQQEHCEQEFRLNVPLFQHLDQNYKTDYWYHISAKKIERTNEVFLLWSIKDVTMQRISQETSFQNLQEAINHLDQAPAGFLSVNKSGEIIYLNATFAAWFGINLATFNVGNIKFETLFAKIDTDNLWHDIVEKTKANGFYHFSLDHLPTPVENSKFDVFVSMANENNNEALYRIVITQHEKMNELPITPMPDDGIFHQYFDTCPFALAIVDIDGRILLKNEKFKKDITQSSPQLGNAVIVDLFAQESRRAISNALKKCLSGQNIEDSIDTVLDKNKDRHLRIFIQPLKNTGEAAQHMKAMVAVLEVTEQKSFEDRMAESQKMQAVGQLAGGIAHDFNNVLTAILMSCDLLLSNHRSSDPSHADLINIKNNANRAAALVQQLLAFSRRQTLLPQVVDLTELLSDSRNLVTPLLGYKVQLKFLHGRDLWRVEVDQASMQRVIMNLVINARDAMPDGGTVTITTYNLSQQDSRNFAYPGLSINDYVVMDISDTGTGISAIVQEKMFEPFFTTKEVGKGTGLGLSMVYGIIKQSGGYIYCESQEGFGTTFRILLPRYIETNASQDIQLIESTKEQIEKPTDLSGTATVLLVEDEDAVRMGGVRALQSRGYTVLEASTGVEALEVLEEHSGAVDIVVSDVVMPEMDGPTLLGELRKLYPDIKFIFVSGYAKDAFAKNLPEGAAFGFLSKPFSLKQLATAVKEALEE